MAFPGDTVRYHKIVAAREIAKCHGRIVKGRNAEEGNARSNGEITCRVRTGETSNIHF